MKFRIGKKIINRDSSPFIIAEIAQAHDGNINFAHSYIDAVAKAGVDAIKFQTHIAQEETTQDEPWRIKFSRIDKSRFDYWKRMEFSSHEWLALKEHADDLGLIFLSSPFSIKAAKLLSKLNMGAWKIASGEVSNLPLIHEICRAKSPVIFSSGLSNWSELDEAIKVTKLNKIPFSVMHCTTMYPTPPKHSGLRLINEISDRYNCVVGLSDHSGEIYNSLAAIALGARLIEVHVTFNKQMFGPDTSSSLDLNQLKDLVKGAKHITAGLNSQSTKEDHYNNTISMSKIFKKTIFIKKDLYKGDTLKKSYFEYKKPLCGIPASNFEDVIGKKLKKNIKKGQALQFSHIQK